MTEETKVIDLVERQLEELRQFAETQRIPVMVEVPYHDANGGYHTAHVLEPDIITPRKVY